MITAPYNFVPLNREVFYPDWADKVSHDVPFEDGESGEIKIKITAKSPIFVRDGENDEHFCSYNGKAYIPGSSLKGEIRTILDVLSYGKLKLQNKVLSYRDLNHESYKKKAMDGNKIHMGWLYRKNGKLQIDDLGTVTASQSRIRYDEMKEILDESTVNKIRPQREAFQKYKIIKDRKKLDTEQGTIVFTGTVGKKTREFLFPKKTNRTLSVSEDTFKTFKEAYYIDTPNESKNWKEYWRREFSQNRKIPVFFQMKNKDTIAHFGLSMLYKLPYEQSIEDILEKNQNFKKYVPDLGETIFGYAYKNKALKGRVFVSHCFAEKTNEIDKKATLALSSPRATFFPAYLEQNMDANDKTKRYVTYDDKRAVLRGFKFYYPHRKATFVSDICKKHPKVCTSFYPLGEGTTFKGKIRFFNLKKAELGALLAVLTMMEQKDTYHRLGMAKPYGFGTVSIDVSLIKNGQKDEMLQSECIAHFKQMMQDELGVDLENEDRIKALWTLHRYAPSDDKLLYLDIKSFVFAKNSSNRYCLPTVGRWAKNKPNKGNQDRKKDKKRSNAKPQATLNDLAEKFGGIKTQPKKRQENNQKPKQPFRNTIKKVSKERTSQTATPNDTLYSASDIAKILHISEQEVIKLSKQTNMGMPAKFYEGARVVKPSQYEGLLRKIRELL